MAGTFIRNEKKRVFFNKTERKMESKKIWSVFILSLMKRNYDINDGIVGKMSLEKDQKRNGSRKLRW